MKYKIVSVKGNSVRVSVSDILTIDIMVINENGKYKIRLPKEVFVCDFPSLVGIVLAAYENSMIDKETLYEKIKSTGN